MREFEIGRHPTRITSRPSSSPRWAYSRTRSTGPDEAGRRDAQAASLLADAHRLHDPRLHRLRRARGGRLRRARPHHPRARLAAGGDRAADALAAGGRLTGASATRCSPRISRSRASSRRTSAAIEGWAIFMDCDMLVLDDIAKLWNAARRALRGAGGEARPRAEGGGQVPRARCRPSTRRRTGRR